MRAEPVSPVAPGLPGPVVMSQWWRDLAFVHWAVEPARVARFMPPGVRPDTHDGATYVGLVPFRMVDAGFGHGPAVPWFGTFLETNVRLYSVDEHGRRGVVFLSLDADRLAVVLGARATLRLPYRWARMRHRREHQTTGERHTYETHLRGRRLARSRLVLDVGAPREATALDHFLTARWGLHTRVGGTTLYVPNAHPTWPLHDAEVVDLADGLLASVGLPGLSRRTPDHVAFSPGVRTTFGRPGLAGRPTSGRRPLPARGAGHP